MNVVCSRIRQIGTITMGTKYYIIYIIGYLSTYYFHFRFLPPPSPLRHQHSLHTDIHSRTQIYTIVVGVIVVATISKRQSRSTRLSVIVYSSLACIFPCRSVVYRRPYYYYLVQIVIFFCKKYSNFLRPTGRLIYSLARRTTPTQTHTCKYIEYTRIL